MSGGASLQWFRLIETIEPYASWAFRASLLVTLLAFAYIALGIFTKADVFTSQLRPASAILIGSLILVSISAESFSISSWRRSASVSLFLAWRFILAARPLSVNWGNRRPRRLWSRCCKRARCHSSCWAVYEYLVDMVLWLIGPARPHETARRHRCG